jgi:hypothetical protein
MGQDGERGKSEEHCMKRRIPDISELSFDGNLTLSDSTNRGVHGERRGCRFGGFANELNC